MAATGQWNGTKQRGWSSGSVPESAADMPCLVMACKGIVNSNQAPDFVISTSIKAGRCLGRGVCVSFMSACTIAATEGSAGTLLSISVHGRFYESQLHLAFLTSFSVFCLCCQNLSKYKHICEKGIAGIRCYPNNYFLHEKYVALPDLSL